MDHAVYMNSILLQTALGVMMPFVGTSLGAACVFFLRGQMSERLSRILTGFAAGIMVSASFFSLLSPALDMAQGWGRLAFLPATLGFLVGMLFLLVLDLLVPHMHADLSEEGPARGLGRTTKLVLAVTLHNIPEGMAVGIVYAGWLSGSAALSATGALALALGIALQNFPEGAVVSMPLLSEGVSKRKTFVLGVLSGAVEPLGALVMIAAASFFLPLMPWLLSFAAGAMFYVVVEELIPEMSSGAHSNLGSIFFALGFALMMVLDVALG